VTTSTIQVEIQEASTEVAADFGLEPDTEGISRHRRRHIDGLPRGLETSTGGSSPTGCGPAPQALQHRRRHGYVPELTSSNSRRTAGYLITVYEMVRTAFDDNEQPIMDFCTASCPEVARPSGARRPLFRRDTAG
jgi:hypothetical protein